MQLLSQPWQAVHRAAMRSSLLWGRALGQRPHWAWAGLPCLLNGMPFSICTESGSKDLQTDWVLACCSGPLPEDLFSGLEDLCVSSPGTQEAGDVAMHTTPPLSLQEPSHPPSSPAASSLLRQVPRRYGICWCLHAIVLMADGLPAWQTGGLPESAYVHA
jgi:hypothetical protein